MGVVASDSIQLASLKTVKDAAIQAQAQAASATQSAQSAQNSATAAGESAARAQAAADAAQGDIDEMSEYFWHDALGAHILSDTSDVSGVRYRTDLKGAGQTINRLNTDGTESEMAKFSSDLVRIGIETDRNITMTSGNMSFYNEYGDVVGKIESSEPFDVVVSNKTVSETAYHLPSEHTQGQSIEFDLPAPKTIVSNTIDLYFEVLTSAQAGQRHHEVGASVSVTSNEETTEQIVWFYDGDEYSETSPYSTITYDGDKHFTLFIGTAIDAIRGSDPGVAIEVLASYTYNTVAAKYQFGLNSTASGLYSFAEGYGTTASGDYSHAEGYMTQATGIYSHAEGCRSQANHSYVHAEGYVCVADAPASHAEGFNTHARGSSSHTEGRETEVTQGATNAHAEGENTIASGIGAHAEGFSSVASGNYSHAGGSNTIASGDSQFVTGRFNADDADALFIIGNGTSDTDRSNAFKINDRGYMFRCGSVLGCDLRLTDASSQIGQAPSTDKYTAPFLLKDSAGTNTCYIQNVIYANGNLRTDYMTSRLDASGTRLMNGFYQHIYADGTYGITFTNAATKAAWLNGLGAAEATINMGNPTIASGVGATVAANASCKTGQQVSVSLRLTGAKLGSGTAAICTLPSGFRPSSEAVCVVMVAGVYRNGSVSKGGVINVYGGVAVTGAEIKLLSTFRTN